MNLTFELEDLKQNGVIAISGELTVKKPSYFKLQKYGNKVHVDLYLDGNRLEFFDTFSNADQKINKWLKEMDELAEFEKDRILSKYK